MTCTCNPSSESSGYQRTSKVCLTGDEPRRKLGSFYYTGRSCVIGIRQKAKSKILDILRPLYAHVQESMPVHTWTHTWCLIWCSIIYHSIAMSDVRVCILFLTKCLSILSSSRKFWAVCPHCLMYRDIGTENLMMNPRLFIGWTEFNIL